MPDRLVGVVTAMPSELRPLRRRLSLQPGENGHQTGRIGSTDIVAVITGIGTARARAATSRLIERHPVDAVAMVGIAGAVDPDLAIAALLSPLAVVDATTGARHGVDIDSGTPQHGVLWTSDDFVTDEARIEHLRADGVVAVDMETGAVAGVCAEAGVSLRVFRAISDRAGPTELAGVPLDLVRPDGRPDVAAAARFVLGHPGRLPALARLGRDARHAARVAADAAVEWLAAS